jgi:hypothetical protein
LPILWVPTQCDRNEILNWIHIQEADAPFSERTKTLNTDHRKAKDYIVVQYTLDRRLDNSQSRPEVTGE